MEVLERPHDESGSIDPFPHEEWDRQIETSGPLPETKQESGSSIEDALGLPKPIDLWPGHVYVPPPVKQLKQFLDLINRFNSDVPKTNEDVMVIVEESSRLIAGIARRIDNYEAKPVTVDDVQDEFNPEELGQILTFIMQDQGVIAEGVQGNSPSGRQIGLKSFLQSAASTTPTLFENAPN